MKRLIDLPIAFIVAAFLAGVLALSLVFQNYNDLPIEIGWRTAFVYAGAVLFCVGLAWARWRALPIAVAALVVANALALAPHYSVLTMQCPDCARGEQVRSETLPDVLQFLGYATAMALATIAAGAMFAVGVKRLLHAKTALGAA